MSVWTADDWTFHLFEVRCSCGWFLSEAEPNMGANGVVGATGVCKRHGKVAAATYEVMDAESGTEE